MARYRLRYVTYAAEQLRYMPRSLHAAFAARIDDLERDPYAAGDYNEGVGSYSTTFSGGEESGIILYVASDKIMTVTIFRVNWVKW
ncbi:MAG: hypothetical protein ABIZ05_00670 [Pseudonocardiaceae bacterium]